MPDQTKFAKLAHTRILIIGGTSGLGYGVAEAVLEQSPPPAAVIISSRNPSRVDAAISRLQTSYPSKASLVSGHTVDLLPADDSHLERNLTRLLDAATNGGTDKLDHVVHSAGDPLAVIPMPDADMAAIKRAGMVRFFTPLLLGKLLPRYVNPGPKSSFTFTTGGVAERPHKDWAIIGSYAAGLYGMCRGLALDLAPLRVNVVAPGFVDTEMWEGLGEEAVERMKREVKEGLPTGRLPTPGDVAEQYVASMRDWNCTGTVFSSNGGGLLK